MTRPLSSYRRITVKIGSALLVDRSTGLKKDWLSSLVADVSALWAQGSEVLVVSSGAIALGRTILGLGLYGGAAILYIVALRRIPMSVALPCTAISYVAAAAIGHFAFGEPMGMQHIAALALICSGVVLLALA